MWHGFSNQNNIFLDYYIVHICIMLDKDINDYLLQKKLKIIFQISTMMH
jgi:hypothetical protein